MHLGESGKCKTGVEIVYNYGSNQEDSLQRIKRRWRIKIRIRIRIRIKYPYVGGEISQEAAFKLW